jgi:hypothetical protein
MLKCRFTLRVAMIASSLFCLLSCTAQAGNKTSREQINEQLEAVIATVRTGATTNIRDAAAEHLSDLTRQVPPSEIDHKTIADIVSLLDLPIGRLWVASSLANIGPPAKMAIPKLQGLLVVEDCLQLAGLSASFAIRRALERMGVTPPPFPVPCPKISSPPMSTE